MIVTVFVSIRKTYYGMYHTFKLCESVADNEFCEWAQVGIDVYIPHYKYQVKSVSPPWFSSDCAYTFARKNCFSHLYQQNEFSASEVKFTEASNRQKGFLKLPKMLMQVKQKVLLLARNFTLVIPAESNLSGKRYTCCTSSI